MGNSLKINTDAVVNTADIITSFKKSLVESRSLADKAVSQLNNVWDSPGASKMINIYNKLKNDTCQGVQKVFNNYAIILNNQVSDGYIAAEENNKKLADKFK